MLRNVAQKNSIPLVSMSAACKIYFSKHYDPWKYKIARLQKGDVVFLYQSGAGIVAVGEADGKLVKCPYHEDPEEADEEYFMKLRRFQRLSRPLRAAEIKTITGINYVFMGTMFGLDADSGKQIRIFLSDQGLVHG